MGQMRFRAPQPETLLPHAAEWAYIAGLEAIPWRSHNRLEGNVLVVERSIAESGNLYIPWLIPGMGQRVLSTCTLMERQEPYCLVTELARGTVHRARALAAEMESTGREIPEASRVLLEQSLAAFLNALTLQPSAEQEGEKAIRLASEAIQLLTVRNTFDTLTTPAPERRALSTLMVGPLGKTLVPQEASAAFQAAFHAAHIPLAWRHLQPTEDAFQWELAEQQWSWSHAQGLRTLGGPLIQLNPASLPDWIYALQDDYDRFERAAVHYVEAVVRRFAGRIDIWMCAGRLTAASPLTLSEEQKLRLAVAALQAVENAADRSPVLISFDQPWAEYLATEDYDLSPLHFADALVRADLGVSGVTLELNLGYWPGGTQPRDLLAISRHIDRWSLLGIPLIVALNMPSRAGHDPRALGACQVVPAAPTTPATPAMHQDAAADLVLLLLTKPAVQAIIWQQLSDEDPHEFPYSGLLDEDGRPKPLLGALGDVRQRFLT